MRPEDDKLCIHGNFVFALPDGSESWSCEWCEQDARIAKMASRIISAEQGPGYYGWGEKRSRHGEASTQKDLQRPTSDPGQGDA